VQNREVLHGWGDCAYCGGYDYWSNCGDIVEMISSFHAFVIISCAFIMYFAIMTDSL